MRVFSASSAILAAGALLLFSPAMAGARDRPSAVAHSGKAAPGSTSTDGFKRDRTPLPADVTRGGSTSGSPSVGTGSGTIVRGVAGLAVVLGVIYGLYWLLKSAGRSRGGGGDGRIEVLATTALAPGRTVHLIRAGEEVLLVGAAESGVTPLRVYTAQEAEELGLVVPPSSLDTAGLLPSTPDDLGRGQRIVQGLRRWTVRS